MNRTSSRLPAEKPGGCANPVPAIREVGPEILADPKGMRRGRAESPWGALRLVWIDQELVGCGFDSADPADHPVTGWDSGAPSDPRGAQVWVDRWMDAAFSDPAEAIGIRVTGTPFQRRVWAALLEIPRGSTVSYGELASALGMPRAARAVGSACGANPVALWIPCHRVVRADGRLHGYRWGLDRKRGLLDWESRVADRPQPRIEH
ncbi:MAG: hypothetical protein RIT19_3014 [Verrucomicrobiota bacterium]